MGSFINSPNSNFNRNILGKKRNEQVYLQFVPGVVIDVVTSYESAPFNSIRDINAIVAKSHISSDIRYNSAATTKYYPLMRGMVDTPTKGDPVLLCDIGGVNYYLGPLNTINNPNWNIDHLNISDLDLSKGKLGKIKRNENDKKNKSLNFSIIPQYRLQKTYNDNLDNPKGLKKGYRDIHGDMILEGRHGNSLRIGSRNINPYIIFSNGRPTNNIVESTTDGTLLAMLDSGTIHQHFINDSEIQEGSESENQPTIVDSPFILGSDNRDEPKRVIGSNFNYNYDAGQTLLTSDKITINSRIDDITISSKQNIILGSGNESKIISENSTTIEASNFYLGEQSKERTQPLVLGTKLQEFLKEFVEVVMKSHALVQGVPVPVTDSTAAPLLPQLQQLLNKLSTPEFWSEYHYIEDNGNKPE